MRHHNEVQFITGMQDLFMIHTSTFNLIETKEKGDNG